MKNGKRTKLLLLFVICSVVLMALLPAVAFAADLTAGIVTQSAPVDGLITFTVQYTATGVDTATLLAVVGSEAAPSPIADTDIAYIGEQAGTATSLEFKVAESRFTATNNKLYISMGGTGLTSAVVFPTQTIGPDTPQDQPAPTGLVGVAPTVALNDGKITGTTIEMEYKLSTATEYIAASATETTGLVAGTYNVRYAAKTGFNAGADAIVVVKGYQATPTGLVAVPATNNDGKITGVTTAMEYKLSTDTTYTAVTGTEITNLVPGTYNVRLAETDLLSASATTDVIILQNPSDIILVNGTNATITVASAGATISAYVGPRIITISLGATIPTGKIPQAYNNGTAVGITYYSPERNKYIITLPVGSADPTEYKAIDGTISAANTIKYGNVNADSSVNGTDKSQINVFVQKPATSVMKNTVKYLLSADLNGDNNVNGMDKSALNNFIQKSLPFVVLTK